MEKPHKAIFIKFKSEDFGEFILNSKKPIKKINVSSEY